MFQRRARFNNWTACLLILHFFLATRAQNVNTEDSLLSHQSTQIEDSLYAMMDSILLDLTQKYDSIKADDFWHPYDVLGTGSASREVIQVKGVTHQHIPGDFLMWKTAKVGLRQNLIGLTPSSVEIYDSDLNKRATISLSLTLRTMEVWTQWNAEDYTPFMIIMVASTEPSIVVLKSTGEGIEELGSFPLHFQVKTVTVCDVESSEKIMIVPEDSNLPITIYNVDIKAETVHLWFFQQFYEIGYDTAITHQPDTADSFVIISQGFSLNIYEFDGTAKQFKILQTLEMRANCERAFHFTMLYQHFLACVANGRSAEVRFISYNYNMNEYDETDVFQKIEAEEIIPVGIEGSRDDLILIAQDSDKTVKILTYNGLDEFVVGHTCSLDVCRELDNFSNGASFVHEDSAAYIFPTPSSLQTSGAPVIFLSTNIFFRSSPVLDQSLGLFEEFKKLSEQMNIWRHIVTSAEDTLAHTLSVNGDTLVTGSWTVNGITTEKVSLEGRQEEHNSEYVFNNLKFGDVEWTEEDFASSHEEIREGLIEVGTNIHFLEEKLKDALLRNSSNLQRVTATTLVNGEITANMAYVKKFMGTNLWGQRPLDFFNLLANSGHDNITISGDILFSEPLTVNELQTTAINQVPVASWARLSADNVFQCKTTFETLEALQDVVVTTVNGIDLAQSVVRPEEASDLHFVDGIVAYGGARTVEHYPFEEIMLSSVSQTVTSPVVFDFAEIASPVSVQLLNGKDFQAFVDKIITNDHEGKIFGEKKFTNAVSAKTLFIEKTWNGLDFPQAFFPTSSAVVELTGQKQFAKIIADNAIVKGKIDGVNTNDLVSLSQPDDLIGSVWNFHSKARIRTNMEVENEVDGIRMETLVHTGTLDKPSTTYTPNADIIFKQPLNIQRLHVNAEINDKSFDELFGHLILFDGDECWIPGKTIITHDAAFGQMRIGDNKINDFTVENFLTWDTPQTIERPVIFSGNVVFNELYALKDFDTVRVADILAKALRVSDSMSATIPNSGVLGCNWTIHFEHIVCESSLRVEGPINGVRNYETGVALTRGRKPNVFTGPVILNKPTVGRLSTAELKLDPGHTLQSLDVSEWNENRAKLSEPLVFSEPFTVNSIFVKGDLDTSSVNGVPIDTLQHHVFRNDRAFQEFEGPVIVLNGITVFNGHVEFRELVDGFSIDDLIQHGFPLNTESEFPIEIKNSFKFQSLIVDKDVELHGPVCGVDLKKLMSESLLRGEENVKIFGETRFTQPLAIGGNLAAPQVNGKSLSQVLLLDGDHQNVEGPATFSSDVFINSLHVPSINGIPIAWLSSIYSYKDGQHVVNHAVFMKDFRTESLQVSGKIQGHDLNQFLETCVKLTDRVITFSEPVTFEKEIKVGGDVETQIYNDIEIDKLKTNTVRLDENITVSQSVTFKGLLETGELEVNGDLNATNLANGLDWNELMRNAIFITNDDQNLHLNNMQFEQLTISRPLVTKQINGIPFEDYVTTNSEQHLGTLKINRLFLEGSNVEIGGQFGPAKISEAFRDTLMANKLEGQRVAGTVAIKGPVEVLGNIECFPEDFIQNIVTTHEPIILQGPVTFTAPLVVEKDVHVENPTILGHPIRSIFEGTFSSDPSSEKQVIYSNWTFTGPVIFRGEVSGPGLQESLNVESLILEKEEELRKAERQVASEKEIFLSQCKALLKIGRNLARSPVKLDSFDVHQIIALKQEAKSILAVENNGNAMLLVQTTTCLLKRYQWNPISDSFQTIIEKPTIFGNILAWQSAWHEPSATSVIALSKSPSACSDESGLFFMIVSPNGDLSVPSTISFITPISFKLVAKADSSEVMLFTLYGDRSLELGVLRWDGTHFVQDGLLQFDQPMDRVDATGTATGFSILCHNRDSLHMFVWSTSASNHRVEMESVQAVLATTKEPLTVFESFGMTYALIPESGVTPALIQPTCNFNVMRFSPRDGTVQSVQKLQLPEVKSATRWSYDGKTYMAFLSKSHGLSVHMFKGLNGFEQLGEPYKIFGGQILTSFTVKRAEYTMPVPFLVLLNPNSIEIYRGNVFGDTIHVDLSHLCY